MRIFTKILLFTLIFTSIAFAQKNKDPLKGKYAIVRVNTPVLNTKDFKSVFGGTRGDRIKTDKDGYIRELEFIALEDDVFEILESYPIDDYYILKVKTSEYSTNSGLYIDSRFVKIENKNPGKRKKEEMSFDSIVKNLKSLEGEPYMWGGNFAEGIPELLKYYPPEIDLSKEEKDLWCLRGVDCSGMLYQATGGRTPRNSSALVHFGKPVEIEDKELDEIIDVIKPLDIIAWDGHILVVLDNKYIIESSPTTGVHKTEIEKRLKWILRERKPVNDWDNSTEARFVIRRWFEEE